MTTTFDAHANLAYGLITAGPGLSGTQLEVAPEDAGTFPDPPFNATAWPPLVQPSAENAEVVRVTDTQGILFTIMRAQEDTPVARNIQVGWQLAAGPTAKTLTDVESVAATASTAASSALSTANSAASTASSAQTLASGSAAGAARGLTSLQLLPVQGVATTSQTAVAGAHTPFDASGGNLTVSLPTGRPGGSLISLEKIDNGTNLVVLNGSLRGVPASSLSLQLSHEQIILEADSAGSWWPIGSHKTLASLDARYAALIAADIASDPGVLAAATAAVAAATAAAGVLTATASDDDANGLLLTFTDSQGNRSWLEYDLAGNPTSLSASRIVITTAPLMGPALGISVGADSALTGYSFVFLDSAGNISPHLQLGEDGRFTKAALADIATFIGVQPASIGLTQLTADVVARLPSNPPAQYVAQVLGGNLYGFSTATGVRKQLSTGNSPVGAVGHGDGYITWADNNGLWARKADASGPVLPQFHVAGAGAEAEGDSMTQGGTPGVTTPWPALLATALGCTVVNGGYGSRTSTEIAIYNGAINPGLTLAGGKLPSGSTSPITVSDITPEHSYQQGHSWTYTGYITVSSTQYAGTLSWVGSGAVTGSTLGTFTFTPSSAPGSDVTVPAGTPFHCTDHDADLLRSRIIWVGINNIGVSGPPVTAADIAPDVAAMIAAVGVYAKQFLVMGPIGRQDQPAATSYQQTIVAANQQLGGIYGYCTPINPGGGSFFDLRSYLIANGLAAAGMTATSQDLTDIANGCVPTQLLGDGVEHPNQACDQVIANWVASIVGPSGKGWIL